MKKQLQKNANINNNIYYSLTSMHKITTEGLTCREKSINHSKDKRNIGKLDL